MKSDIEPVILIFWRLNQPPPHVLDLTIRDEPHGDSAGACTRTGRGLEVNRDEAFCPECTTRSEPFDDVGI